MFKTKTIFTGKEGEGDRDPSDLRIRNFFQCMIRADSKSRLGVWRQRDSSVRTQLEHILCRSSPRQHLPLVHGAVDAARRYAHVVRRPHHTFHLAVVALEVRHVVKRRRGVDHHDVAVDSGQIMTTVTEAALPYRHTSYYDLEDETARQHSHNQH